ncbi:SHOCT domain-containing protein [Nocardioides panacisoli]|uniref:SHOCT domain-containing protein n=1 Tax=Nocardioides panacisoli TaxID=627624 RepID=UPI0031E1036B
MLNDAKRAESLQLGLAILGGELVDEPARGTPGAKLRALDEARERGDITQDEFRDAVRRLLRGAGER